MESKSFQTAWNRAYQRGDYDRVAQLAAVPMEKRATWSAKENPPKPVSKSKSVPLY